MNRYLLIIAVLLSMSFVTADGTIYTHIDEWSQDVPVNLPGAVATMFGDENIQINILSSQGDVDVQFIVVLQDNQLQALHTTEINNQNLGVANLSKNIPTKYDYEINATAQTFHELLHSTQFSDDYRSYKKNGLLSVETTTVGAAMKMGVVNTFLWIGSWF